MKHAHIRSRLARLLGAPALLLAALPLLAQGAPGGAIPDFHRIDDYVLVVDGKPVQSAEMFQAERTPAILILSSALPAPVLLRAGAQTGETLNQMKVAKQADGTVDLLPGSTLAPQGKFGYGKGDVTFTVDGRKTVLKEKPSLLGPQTSAALKTYSPSTYAAGAKAYQPDQASIAALRRAAAPVTVRVFFGSWCPHCQQSLPKLIKVEEALKGSKVRFEYFGLPKQGMGEVPEFKRYGLNGVPSGLVFINGREAGRMVTGEDWVTPEVVLKSIVTGAPATSR